jgi:hypothetical protein
LSSSALLHCEVAGPFHQGTAPAGTAATDTHRMLFEDCCCILSAQCVGNTTVKHCLQGSAFA